MFSKISKKNKKKFLQKFLKKLRKKFLNFLKSFSLWEGKGLGECWGVESSGKAAG